MRTQGEVKSVDGYAIVIGSTIAGESYAWSECSGEVPISREEADANAQTWATAHNVANKLDAMGVDGLKAIEGLVELVSEHQSTTEAFVGQDRIYQYASDLSDFMQSIQRKDHEKCT